MASRKQKEQLIEVLKFPPIKARILVQGYGGECYIGSVSREAYDYFKSKRIDIEQYANGWDDVFDDVPDQYRIFSPGSPYDCDNRFHSSGATMDDSNLIEITDEQGNVIWSSVLDISALENAGVDVSCHECWEPAGEAPGTVIFWGGQGEKGCFFDGEFVLRAPFDPAKLHIAYSEADGWALNDAIEYDGEEIDGSGGYSTNGKWVEHKFLIIGDEKVYRGVERSIDDNEEEEDIPVLENEELWASTVIDKETFNGIPYSPWFTDGEMPVRRGEYEVVHGESAWAFSFMAKWTGKVWKANNKEIQIKKWRGLSQPAK